MTTVPLLLVVEDEMLLHDAIEEELRDAGFDPLMVSSGTKAVEELKHNPARFRALITDIRLGSGPNGWEVAHIAREMVPSLPVVYMSGDSAAQWAANGVPKSLMLAKPFAFAQLVTAVSQVITEADTNLSGAPLSIG